MFTQHTIPCPRCQISVVVDIWQVLDLNSQPELASRFLQGEINVLHCPECGVNGLLPFPLAIHDPHRERLIIYIPQNHNWDEATVNQIVQQLWQAVGDTISGSLPDYLFSPLMVETLDTVAELLVSEETY